MRLAKNVMRSENFDMLLCEGVMTLILMNEPSVFELPDSIRLKRTCYLQCEDRGEEEEPFSGHYVIYLTMYDNTHSEGVHGIFTSQYLCTENLFLF